MSGCEACAHGLHDVAECDMAESRQEAGPMGDEREHMLVTALAEAKREIERLQKERDNARAVALHVPECECSTDLRCVNVQLAERGRLYKAALIAEEQGR